MNEYKKDKTFGRTAGTLGGVSGVASILGSWQICHSVCLGLIALLSVIGITINGMPLSFFTKISVPLWTIAVILLIIVSLLYIKKHCISKNLLLLNLGLIIAGTPFNFVYKFQFILWIIGGAIVLASILLFIRERIENKKCKRCEHGN